MLSLAERPRWQSLPDLEEPLPGIAFQEFEPMPDIVERIVVRLQSFGDFLPIDRGRDGRLRVPPRRVGGDPGRATAVAQVVDENPSSARALDGGGDIFLRMVLGHSRRNR